MRARTKIVVAEYRAQAAEAKAEHQEALRQLGGDHQKDVAVAVEHLLLEVEELEQRAETAEAARHIKFTTSPDGVPAVHDKRHRFSDEFFDVAVKILALGVPPGKVKSVIETACKCFGQCTFCPTPPAPFCLACHVKNGGRALCEADTLAHEPCAGISYDSLPKSDAPMKSAEKILGVLTKQQVADFMQHGASAEDNAARKEKVYYQLLVRSLSPHLPPSLD